MNPFYDLLKKFDSATEVEQEVTTPEETVYEEVEAQGDIMSAVKQLEEKYKNYTDSEQLDERHFSDKKTFDKLAEPGDTYKTADGGTVTKTEKGIKHSAPSGKYGAGPEDEKDELDEKAVNPYAVGMAQAMKSTGDEPPLKKSTIKKAHKIAKAVEKQDESVELDESKADIRNHPIYTNEEAWEHYSKELAEQDKEEAVNIQDELSEISRLAGLAEKVGGNKVDDFVDDVTQDEDKKCDEGFDPKSFDGEMNYEFAGDDGEPGYGHVQYTANVVDGRPVVDPKSLKATCNGDGNNKLTDEWCSEMVAPGGSDHQDALVAAQEDADEQWEERDVDIPMDEDAIEEAVSRKDFQMVADLLKNIDDADKRKELAQHHAGIFKQQNPRFDTDRFMKAAGLMEDDVEEGNEFTGALAKAKADGKKEFEVDGKTYKVEEAAKPDFLDLDKDGDKEEPMKKAAKDKEEMKEDQQINEDINLNITATGAEDVINLARKLSGMPPIVLMAKPEQETPCGMEEDLEEERDIEYANTPDEKVAPVSAAVPAGTDYHKAKKSYPKTAGGDNPMALEEKDLEEGLWNEYQSMIAEVKKDENA